MTGDLHFPQAAPRPRSRSLIVFIAAASAPSSHAPAAPGAEADRRRIAELERENARLRAALDYHRAAAARPLRETSATGALLDRLRRAAAAAGATAPIRETLQRRASIRRGDALPTIR